MKIRELLEAKSQKVPAQKPRNFVAKNAINTGAGAHKDKKKAIKQGDVKHKAKQFVEGVAEGVDIVGQDSDLDQQVFTLNVDGKTVSFTYWDYENNFQSPDIKDIYQQAREQLGKKLSPEQIKAVARSVFKSFKSGVAEGPEDNTAQQRKTERDKQRTAPAQKARNQAQRKGLKQDKDGTYYAKEGDALGVSHHIKQDKQ